MPRPGVSRDDVFKAADALALRGERPTVERVRHHLGTGSPNTVTPLLDQWWKAMGPRLAGIAPAPGEPADGVPLEIRNAVRGIWDTALAAANHKLQRELRAEREALAEAVAKVRDRELSLDAARGGLEEAVRAANARAEDLRRQLEDAAGAAQQAAQLASARMADLQTHIEQLTERARRAEETEARARQDLQQHADERRADAERAVGNERRLLQELDRERSQASAALAQAQREATASRAQAQREVDAARKQSAHAETQLAEQTARASDVERAAGQLRTDLATVQAKLDAIAHTEAALQRENEAHQARIRELTAALDESRHLVQELRAAARAPRAKASKSFSR